MVQPNQESDLLLTRYLDGELEGEPLARLERLLETDAALRGELESLKALRVRLRGAVGTLEVPAGLESQINAATAGRRTLLRPAAWGRLQTVGAASFALLLALITWQFLRSPYSLLTELPPPVAAVLEMGIGTHVACVRERIADLTHALGTYSSPIPEDERRLLEAARSALPPGLELVEQHVCGTPERRFAHLILRKDGHYLSVLVTPRKQDDPDLPGSRYATITGNGVHVYAVRHDGLDVGAFALPTQYAFLASDAGAEEIAGYSRRVAASVQGTR